MKKFLSSRTSILILGAVALLALLYLAASLRSIEFEPAQTFQIEQSSTDTPAALMLPDVPLWQQVLFWVITLFVIMSIFVVFSPKERKKLAKRLGNLALVLLVLIYLGYRYGSTVLQSTPESGEPGQIEAVSPPSAASDGNLAEQPAPPAIPPAASFAVTLLIVFGVMVLSWWLITRKQTRRVPPPLEEIAEIARTALGDLTAGKDWGDTIINCYVRMNASVGERRGCRRKRGTTPAEFADELERAGLPGYTTRRLTQLFERVRYGAKKSSKEDIHEAIACLTDILHACGEAL